jgi:hypothetical protein
MRVLSNRTWRTNEESVQLWTVRPHRRAPSPCDAKVIAVRGRWTPHGLVGPVAVTRNIYMYVLDRNIDCSGFRSAIAHQKQPNNNIITIVYQWSKDLQDLTVMEWFHSLCSVVLVERDEQMNSHFVMITQHDSLQRCNLTCSELQDGRALMVLVCKGWSSRHYYDSYIHSLDETELTF